MRSSSLLVSMVMASTLVAGCSDSGVKNTPAPTAKNANVITLGLVGSFAGADADVANQVRLGAELAVSQLNAVGGVLGKHIALRIEDDQGQPDVSLQKFQQLIADGVTVGIGPTTSAAGLKVLDLARSDKMLFISPSASSPDLDTPLIPGDNSLQPNLLRTYPSDVLQAAALTFVALQTHETLPDDASLTTGHARCSSAIVVYQKDAYGVPVYERLKNGLVSLNVALAKTVELNAQDLTDAALRGAASQVATGAVNTKANCQVVVAQPQLGGAYMRAYRDFISDPVIEVERDWPSFTTIGSDGFTQQAFVTAGRTNPADPLSDTAGNGSVSVAADTRPQSQTYAVFRESYIAHNPGTEPGQFASTAYDAVMILSVAMEKAKTPSDHVALRAALGSLSAGASVNPASPLAMLTAVRTAVAAGGAGAALNYDGVSGRVDFLPSGGVLGDFVVGHIVKNQFVPFRTTLSSDTLSSFSFASTN